MLADIPDLHQYRSMTSSAQLSRTQTVVTTMSADWSATLHGRPLSVPDHVVVSDCMSLLETTMETWTTSWPITRTCSHPPRGGGLSWSMSARHDGLVGSLQGRPLDRPRASRLGTRLTTEGSRTSRPDQRRSSSSWTERLIQWWCRSGRPCMHETRGDAMQCRCSRAPVRAAMELSSTGPVLFLHTSPLPLTSRGASSPASFIFQVPRRWSTAALGDGRRRRGAGLRPGCGRATREPPLQASQECWSRKYKLHACMLCFS
jgi:hypothetical protein